MNKILEHIEREANIPGLASILAERLSPTDLQSLLLEVYRLRSGQRTPSEILASYESDRFVRPSPADPRHLVAWEQAAFACLPPGFQVLELSPVCPLGTCSVVAGVDQNWSVATARNSEVVSDSTNVLALECAMRRRHLLRSNPKSKEAVHLATSHRLLRAQRYDRPDLAPHFSAFTLCSAGQDQGNLQFELIALGQHIRFYLRTLRSYLGAGVPFYLSITDFNPNPRYDMLNDQLLSPIRSEFEGTETSFDDQRTAGKRYYLDLCFHIHGINSTGRRLELVDGGLGDWTQRLLSNARERLVISGVGSERVCAEFDTNRQL